MKLAFASNRGLAGEGMPVWLEAAVLAAGQGNEVAIVVPEAWRRGAVDARLAGMGVRIVFCPLRPPWGLGGWLGIGRAKRLAWWRGEFPEPPDAVCLAADGVRESLPGCLEWLRERRSGYVEAAEPPMADGGGRRTEGRVAPEDRRSEIGDREPENCEPRMARMGTDEGRKAGLRPGSRAGAAFSNPSTSELARDSENTSPIRYADGPASIPATSYSLPATAPEALVGGAGELLAAMYRLAARDGVTRYHKWRGLPFLWDEEWI
jgi:hypothetical protein